MLPEEGMEFPSVTRAELADIEKRLRHFGGNSAALSEGRRFAEGISRGRHVIFDHECVPPRPIGTWAGLDSQRYLPLVACILNCWDTIIGGMEVSGLDLQHMYALWELPDRLREDILIFETNQVVFPAWIRRSA
jgi:hypothetical protein